MSALRSSIRLGAVLSPQLVVSATSLALSVLLMYSLPVDGYGMYVLASAAALFTSGLFTATFVSRTAVALGAAREHDRPSLVQDGLAVTAVAGVCVVLVGLVAAPFAGGAGWPVLALCGFTLMRDGAVRITNAAGHGRSAVAAALVFSVIALSGALVPLVRGETVSLFSALAPLCTGLLAALLLAWVAERVPARAAVRGAAELGAWVRKLLTLRDGLAGGFFVVWLQAQAVLFVTGHYLADAGVAQLGAARIFSSPLVFLSQAIAPVAIARISGGDTASPLLARRYLVASASFAAAYLALGAPVAVVLAEWVIPSAIAVSAPVIAATVGLSALQFGKDAVRFIAVAERRDRDVFFASVAGLACSALACSVVVLAAEPSIPLFLGAFGAGEIVSAGVLYRSIALRGAAGATP